MTIILYKMSNNATSNSSSGSNVATNNHSKTITDDTTKNIIDNINNKYNPKTCSEGLQLLNNPDKLMSHLTAGADEFKTKTGREMTYSEMRMMFG